MLTDPGGVIPIDSHMGGMAEVTAVYLIPGPRPALIEAAPATSLDAVLKGLSEAGSPDIAWIILTHIHVDHAGAAGHLARLFPQARVVVRAEGAPHLADPARLWASASRLYPDIETRYGEMLSIDPQRIDAVSEDGPVADIGGGRSIEALYTPGHARHHMSLFDPSAGNLFAGDALGVALPGAAGIRPAFPPPDFDLEVSLKSIAKMAGMFASRVYPTHFGAVPDPAAIFGQAEAALRQWVEAAEKVFAGGGDAAEAAAAFEDLEGSGGETAAKLEYAMPRQHNALGVKRYLEHRNLG